MLKLVKLQNQEKLVISCLLEMVLLVAKDLEMLNQHWKAKMILATGGSIFLSF